MKTVAEVDYFSVKCYDSVVRGCKECRGHWHDLGCDCSTKYNLMYSAYEACIPKDFWFTEPEDIAHNTGVFSEVVVPFCEKINLAKMRGYGLVFLGDNGVGKTMFISYVLIEAIKAGYTAYYTTLPTLDWNIKRSFNDKEIGRRLQLMLTSDFLAVDELGKEKFKAGDTHMRMQIERILKERFDESMSTLIATNADLKGLEKIYGTTITSILSGKYRTAIMEPGDFRKQLSDKMTSEMGYR